MSTKGCQFLFPSKLQGYKVMIDLRRTIYMNNCKLYQFLKICMASSTAKILLTELNWEILSLRSNPNWNKVHRKNKFLRPLHKTLYPYHYNWDQNLFGYKFWTLFWPPKLKTTFPGYIKNYYFVYVLKFIVMKKFVYYLL